jgi:hypothetical protein
MGVESHTLGIIGFLIHQMRLKVGQWRVASGRVGHDLEASVHEALVKQLLEYPPNTLHESDVHGLVIALKVDPTTKTRNNGLPLRRVAHHNLAALCIVGRDAHFENLITSLSSVSKL